MARRRRISALCRISTAFGVPWLLALVVLLALRGPGDAQPPVLALSSIEASPVEEPASPPPSFNWDIVPILSDACFSCHGPDSAARKAGLRLDQREGALAGGESGRPAIVPGDPEASEIMRRVLSTRASKRMPPPDSGKVLDPAQIELLRRWIESGAHYEPHWALIPPADIEPPSFAGDTFSRNPIDRFVLARLLEHGLTPSPEADPRTLIRRVSLDLTGLPPTPELVERFVADPSDATYGQIVDELLASDAHAEHMARIWLDAARYGDTHGLHLDNERSIWPWRDWVIDAYRRNMPFDQFTIEQLAGDLLEDASPEQVIATGFIRNHVTTSEGGAIDAEYLVKYAADRVETMATVWMGMTLSCAACHDHKFDPISQRDYYQLFAFFNSIDGPAMDGNAKDHPPVMRVTSPDDRVALDALRETIRNLERTLDAPDPAIDADQRDWQQRVRDVWQTQWQVLRPVSAASDGSELEILDDGSILARGEVPERESYEIHLRTDQTNIRLLRLETLTHESLPLGGPGRASNGNFVLSEVEASIRPLGSDEDRTVRLVAVGADYEQPDGPFLVAQTTDGVIDDATGWAPEGHRFHVDRVAVYAFEEPVGFPGGTEITIRLHFQSHFPAHAIGRARLSIGTSPDLQDLTAPLIAGPWHSAGPFAADSNEDAFAHAFAPEQEDLEFVAGEPVGEAVDWQVHREYLDGIVYPFAGERSAMYYARRLVARHDMRVTLGLGSDDAIKVWLDGRLIHENFVARGAAPDQDKVPLDLSAGEHTLLVKVANFGGPGGFASSIEGHGGGSPLLQHLALVLRDDLEDEEATRLKRYYRTSVSPQARAILAHLDDTRRELEQREAMLPTTLIAREMAEPRPTYILRRGEYDKPQEQVLPGFPACITSIDEPYPPTRLGLARWLLDPNHPLTARVAVNRLWQQCFGDGIVRTSEDFGTQGERPSHPELLDWLAREYVAGGWDTRHMLRLIVTSSTYRQSSRATDELLAMDPDNRLLARGPRHRLDAEVIRDQALAASGLLDRTVGGPSVRPYQPEGLWRAVAYPDSNTRVYEVGPPEHQHRRSMYTFWKRTSPPPNLGAFDAPNRETCVVRRARTTTPMQSLVLLNDPQFVECARALAQRAMLEADADIDASINRAFLLLLARPPEPDERAALRRLYDDHVEHYRTHLDEAAALLAVGSAPRDDTIDPAQHAAMTNVCATILSLDEAITKN